MRELYTPFRVQEQASGSWVYVDEVHASDKDELLFIVNGKPCKHQDFSIIINF